MNRPTPEQVSPSLSSTPAGAAPPVAPVPLGDLPDTITMHGLGRAPAQPLTGPRTGVVVIGRNEGERLVRCLKSVTGTAQAVVYVDSGSVDGSCEAAAALGADVVPLDTSIPFSAARARNVGLERLRELDPGVELVQFVDGDCEVIEGWMRAAQRELRSRPDVAIVCGRLRERYPEVSIYNRLCDIEFNRGPGEVQACGGIFMGRIADLRAVGGFNPAVVAGEEPELCLRLRRRGRRIIRLADDMAWHDSAMLRFGQWWRRGVRSGHAYAQGLALHGRGPERYCLRETRGIWLWAAALPIAAAALAVPTGGLSLLALALYPLQAARIALRGAPSHMSAGDRWIFGASCVVVKWPQAVGQLLYLSRVLRRTAPRIIEHKGPARSAPAESTPSS